MANGWENQILQVLPFARHAVGPSTTRAVGRRPFSHMGRTKAIKRAFELSNQTR